MATFVPEYLRDEDESTPSPEYVMSPKLSTDTRFSQLAQNQLKRAPGFVRRKGMAYAIGAGFVKAENPFSGRRVPLPTGTDQCMFEFDPNISSPHIADQLATKVEQALDDPANGRVELYSNKHQRYLSELSHATILSDINFASDVCVERRPDEARRDPAILAAATSRSRAIAQPVDDAEQFSKDVTSKIGECAAGFVIRQPGQWGDNACTLAANSRQLKHIVLKYSMEHPQYRGGKFCKFVRRFGCRPQYMINTLSSMLSHCLNTESAMGFINNYLSPEKLRCELAKRISEAMNTGLLGWIRRCTLKLRKKLRGKACFTDRGEDACGLRSARCSDEDEDPCSSSDEDECDGYVAPIAPRGLFSRRRALQRKCLVCGAPKFRCVCPNAPYFPTDCYGRIKTQIAKSRPIGDGFDSDDDQGAASSEDRTGGDWANFLDNIRKHKDTLSSEGLQELLDILDKATSRRVVTEADWFGAPATYESEAAYEERMETIRAGFRGIVSRTAMTIDDVRSLLQAAIRRAMDREARQFGAARKRSLQEEEARMARAERTMAYEQSQSSRDVQRRASSIRTKFEDAVRNDDQATVDQMMDEHEAQIGGWFDQLSENAQNKYEEAKGSASKMNRLLNPFRRRCHPCDNVEESEDEEEGEDVSSGDEGPEPLPRDDPFDNMDNDEDVEDDDLVEIQSGDGPIFVTRAEYEQLVGDGSVVLTEGGARTVSDEISSLIGCNSCGGKKKGKGKGKGKKKGKKEEKKEEKKLGSNFLVDHTSEPETVKIFERMWKRNPTKMAAIVNPSGPSKTAIVLMPHDKHAKIGEFMALNRTSMTPVHNYLRSVTVELPANANLSGASAISLDGKNTFKFDDDGYEVNGMPIGEDKTFTYGDAGDVTVFPSSFILKRQ